MKLQRFQKIHNNDQESVKNETDKEKPWRKIYM